METLRFEIQTLGPRGWSVRETHSNPSGALVAFKRHVMRTPDTGIRLIRVDADGPDEVPFILEEHTARQSAQAGPTVAPVSLAPLCQSVDDLYALPARIIINHVLRGFLEPLGLTALEGLYDARHFRRLEGSGTLLTQAIGLIARAQMSAIDRGIAQPTLPSGLRVTSSRELVAHIGQLLQENRRNAERVAKLDVKMPTPDTVEAAWQAALGQAKGNPVAGRIVYIAATVGGLREHSQVAGKASAVADLIAADLAGAPASEPAAERLSGMDGLLADCLYQRQMRDILWDGASTLGDQILRLADLAAGDPAVWQAVPDLPGAALAAGIRADRLPECREVLSHLLAKYLESARPLVHDLAEETAALNRLTERLMALYPILGSPTLASALMDRQLLSADTAQGGFKQVALAQLCERVTDPTRRIMLLRDLLAAMGHDEVAPDIARHLIATLSDGERVFAALPSLGSHTAALAFLKEAKALTGQLADYGANVRALHWKLDVLAGRQVLANQRA